MDQLQSRSIDEMGVNLSTFHPLIDLQEAKDKYLLHADLPGVDEANIDISFHSNVLTIKGERENHLEAMEAGAISIERGYGAFCRDITFLSAVDPDKIKAVFKGGVLNIELPKLEIHDNTLRKIKLFH